DIAAKKLPPQGLEIGKPENHQKLKRQVFADNDEHFHRWVLWNTHIRQKQLNFEAYRQNQKIHATRRADFDEWWNGLGARTNALPHDVSQVVLAWLDNANVLPGKRFTGRYSLEQLNLYAAINDALTHKQIVNASTKTSFWRKHNSQG